MKYVSITFDDGREDNYSIAFPILRKNGISATVYCTTGFIDGTWTKKADWYSAEESLSIDQIRELQDNGWEIALHGDRHIAEKKDTQNALKKMAEWGFLTKPIGMSLPDSRSESGVLDIIQAYIPNTINYIRGGRERDTKRLSSKILFGLYTLFRIQAAYNLFNKANVVYFQNKVPRLVPSVVIRLQDKPDMVIKFIRYLPDDTWVSLMLHSIHSDEKVYKNDPWNWKQSKFERLCKSLKAMMDEGSISVLPMQNVLDQIGK